MAQPGRGGVFKDGKWWCDCDPREHAPRYQAKKGRGPNRGRFFYQCVRWRDAAKKCGFYKWEDELPVEQREAPAAKSAAGPVRATRSTQTKINQYLAGQPGLRGGEENDEDEDDPVTVSKKLKRTTDDVIQGSATSIIRNGIDSFAISSDAEDEEGDDTTVRGVSLPQNRQANPPPTTPSKPRAAAGAGGLPTAPKTTTTTNRRLFATGGSSKRTRFASGTTMTPISARTRSGAAGNDGQWQPHSSADDDYDMTKEVMRILSDQPISQDTKQAVRETLNDYALRVRTIQMDRDMIKERSKKKDEEIAKLKAEIKDVRKVVKRSVREGEEYLEEYASQPVSKK
ncbi:hypothetical protein QBC44DRAFT_375259 [Cladorrhinum sp. PSN332]|nr:hypothetical protein QBC44DRAFT_375259 [Cladorrhinum sp. PSN332]